MAKRASEGIAIVGTERTEERYRSVAAAYKQVRYAVITPVRDEEEYIGAMIESIAGQTVPPTKWVIVDDGSTDQTAAIVSRYARKCSFIELVRLPVRDQRM